MHGLAPRLPTCDIDYLISLGFDVPDLEVLWHRDALEWGLPRPDDQEIPFVPHGGGSLKGMTVEEQVG